MSTLFFKCKFENSKIWRNFWVSVLKIHVQNFIKNDEACSFKILCFSDPKNAGDAIDNINIFLFNYGCRANTVNKRKYIDNILIFKFISTKKKKNKKNTDNLAGVKTF